MKRLMVAMMLFLTNAAWAWDGERFLAAMNRQDYAGALRILCPAATQGNADAQNNLGSMYALGRGVVQDDAEAVKWFRLAAAQGHAGAQSNLGLQYGKGQGVVQDYVLAHMWLNVSASSGFEHAVNDRDRVAALMTRQQIAESQKLARECRARKFKNCD